MATTKIKIDKLKKVIAKEVFIRRGEEVFFSKEGTQMEWIFDFRKIALQSQYLNLFADIFWEKFKNKYPFQVGGLETAAIPFIAAIVMKSVENSKPINGFYIRKSRKKYDMMRLIEGKLTDAPIILIDDLINNGSTFTKQIAILEKLDKKISDVFVFLKFRSNDYYDTLNKKGIKINSLFCLEDFGVKISDSITSKPQQELFEVKWYFKSGKPNYFHIVPKSAPIIDDDKIYFGSDDGYLWALNQKDGTTIWKYKIGFFPKNKGIFSTPAIYDNTIYFGAYDGNVYALDTQTGKRKWVFFDADWIGSSPAIAPDLGLLFIGLEFGLFKKKGGIAAIDLKTGKKKWWNAEMPEYTHCSPSYNEKKKVVAIGSNDGVCYMFNAKNGKLLWKYQTSGEIKSSLAFDNERNLVIFGSFDGNLYTLDIDSGEFKGKFKTENILYSTPLIYKGNAYFGSTDKHFYNLNLDTGQLNWKFGATGRFFANPFIIDDKIYIGATNGILYEIDAETGKMTDFFQATERITNKIAYNPKTKRFFLPTYANEIYCLQKQNQFRL